MQRALLLTTTTTLLLAISGSALAFWIHPQEPQKIKRVKRPVFKKRDWDGIYFEDLFRDGLVGERPEKLTDEQLAAQTAKDDQSTTAGQTPAQAGKGWASIISRTTIEDEVKSLQQKLAADITTPGKFKTDYAQVRQSFSMLSMLFAIIRQYDEDVRWKEFGAEAQASFSRAAANARVGTIQAYESCKRRGQELQDLVRGGNFVGTEKPPETLDWSQVVDHSPVMEKLEESYDKLKQLTARQGEFTANAAEALHHSELIAALSVVVQQPGMEYAVEEGYVDFAKKMQAAATSSAAGVRNNDFETVSNSVNTIGQTCSNCHDEWR